MIFLMADNAHGDVWALHGVDDQQVANELRHRAALRAPSWWRILRLVGVLLAIGAASGVVSMLVHSVTGSRLLVVDAVIILALGWSAVSMLDRSSRRGVRRHLVEILREDGRCGRCGFPVEASAAMCPECGGDLAAA